MLAAVACSEGIDNFGFFDTAMPRQPDDMINFPQRIFDSLNKAIDPSASTPSTASFHLLRLCFSLFTICTTCPEKNEKKQQTNQNIQ